MARTLSLVSVAIDLGCVVGGTVHWELGEEMLSRAKCSFQGFSIVFEEIEEAEALHMFQGFSIATQFFKVNATGGFLTSTGMRLLSSSFIIPAELIHTSKC